MDAWLPTYHRLLAASPAPDEPRAVQSYSFVSADTNPFSIMSGDTCAQQNFGKGEKANQKQSFGKQVGSYVAPGAQNIKIGTTPTFADQVAFANHRQTQFSTGVAHETADLTYPSLTCQMDGCTRSVKAQVGGGHCNFRILSGLTKGCGRSFCAQHSGTKNTDDDSDGEDDFFRANNYDEEYGPRALAPFSQSTKDGSRSSLQEIDEQERSFDRNAPSSSTSQSMTPRQRGQKTKANAEINEKKPFDGQVCQECHPRLRRTFKISLAVVCGIPALVSMVCLAVLGHA